MTNLTAKEIQYTHAALEAMDHDQLCEVYDEFTGDRADRRWGGPRLEQEILSAYEDANQRQRDEL